MKKSRLGIGRYVYKHRAAGPCFVGRRQTALHVLDTCHLILVVIA